MPDRCGLNANASFADGDDRHLRRQVSVIFQAQNAPCVLLRLLLADKPPRWSRNEFGSYEINPEVSHDNLLSREDETERRPVLSLRIGDPRPLLESWQIPSLVAHDTDPAAQEQAGQDDSLNPIFRRQGAELVTLAHAAMGRQKRHS